MQPRMRKLLLDGLARIRGEALHGVNLPPPSGTRRGIDVLGSKLEDFWLLSLQRYRLSHGRHANLFSPRGFTEKQVLFKFFGPIPELSPSDKLRSPAYLPVELRSRARLPRRFFVTDKPELPANDELPAGAYFFKSNHSSGTNRRIRYPLSTVERTDALRRAKTWLTKQHAPRSGLWWYEFMPRNVYLEEDLGSELADAPDWKFFVCNGRVEIFQVDVDRSRDHVQTIYERDGTFLPHELYFKSGQPVEMPPQLDDMIALAEGIGRNFDFIRVDFFLKGGSIYLGEIGLVPGGASDRVRSPELDERLGAAWSTPWIGNVSEGYPGGHYGQIRTSGWDW